MEGMRMLWRLLARGIAPGGLPRAWHFLRSLPWRRPALAPLALNDWVAALAMRDYAERHFLAPASRAAISPERALERLHAALRYWRRRGGVRLALHRSGEADAQIAVCVTARLDRALARRLARQLHAALQGSKTRCVLAFEAVGSREELEQLSRALARYGDRVCIVLGEGLRDLLRCEPAAQLT